MSYLSLGRLGGLGHRVQQLPRPCLEDLFETEGSELSRLKAFRSLGGLRALGLAGFRQTFMRSRVSRASDRTPDFRKD